MRPNIRRGSQGVIADSLFTAETILVEYEAAGKKEEDGKEFANAARAAVHGRGRGVARKRGAPPRGHARRSGKERAGPAVRDILRLVWLR